MTNNKEQLQNGISQRLEELVDEKSSGNLRDFANEAGIKYTAIYSNIKTKKLPGAETLFKIHKNFNVSTDWILTGKGEKYLSNGSTGLINKENASPKPDEKPCSNSSEIARLIENHIINQLKKFSHEFDKDDLSLFLIIFDKWNDLNKDDRYETSKLFIELVQKIRKIAPLSKTTNLYFDVIVQHILSKSVHKTR